MPSTSSLREPSPAQSSSIGPSSLASGRSMSSSGHVSRTSPYASDHQHRVIPRKSRAEAHEARRQGGRKHAASLTMDEKAIIAYASDYFLAAACTSNVWELHCDNRTSKAREALVIANRKAVEDGGSAMDITTFAKGRVSYIALCITLTFTNTK